MLGLNIGDGFGDCRCHRARYRLLEGGVHDLRISCNFLKTGNCFRELVCVCEPGGVVKTRKSGCCCSSFSLGDTKKREIYWLGSSYAIGEFLQSEIDVRSLLIAFVVLKLVDGTGKALGFCWKGKKSYSLKIEERKVKKKIYCVRNKDSGFWQYKARSAWDNKARRQTVLLICQGDNLVGGRIMIY